MRPPGLVERVDEDVRGALAVGCSASSGDGVARPLVVLGSEK